MSLILPCIIIIIIRIKFSTLINIKPILFKYDSKIKKYKDYKVLRFPLIN